MKIVTRYVAKDGRTFDDPLKCQDYEDHQMGVIRGSVAALLESLKGLPQDNFCTCIFYISEESGKSIYARVTLDLEPFLSPYVNVEDLDIDARRLTCTIGQLMKGIERYDKDAPVCGMMMHGDNISFNGNVCIFQCNNPECWENKSETR